MDIAHAIRSFRPVYTRESGKLHAPERVEFSAASRRFSTTGRAEARPSQCALDGEGRASARPQWKWLAGQRLETTLVLKPPENGLEQIKKKCHVSPEGRLRPGRLHRALQGHVRKTPFARPRRSAALPRRLEARWEILRRVLNGAPPQPPRAWILKRYAVHPSPESTILSPFSRSSSTWRGWKPHLRKPRDGCSGGPAPVPGFCGFLPRPCGRRKPLRKVGAPQKTGAFRLPFALASGVPSRC
jgi:hypothetical protein